MGRLKWAEVGGGGGGGEKGGDGKGHQCMTMLVMEHGPSHYKSPFLLRTAYCKISPKPNNKQTKKQEHQCQVSKIYATPKTVPIP